MIVANNKTVARKEEMNIVGKCFQKGTVLFVSLCIGLFCHGQSSAQDLIQPAPEMPAYTLGSVNQSKDSFGRPSITIDYQRTKDGVGMAMLAGKISHGPMRVFGSGTVNDASGKLEWSEPFSFGTGLNAELFLVISGSFAEECPFTCLVSNAVRTGNSGGAPSTGREWNDLESAAYQKDLVGRKPPFALPADHQLVRASTKLVPGMPIKVGRYGEWVDAEALTAEAMVTVKISGVAKLRVVTRDGWIAIKPSVLQQGDASPSSFQASAKVIPGTAVIHPEGFVAVTDTMNLFPGTPVQAIWQDQLVDATVMAIEGKQLLNIHYDSKSPAFNQMLDRSSLFIAIQTLEELAKPDAMETFQVRVPNLVEARSGAPMGSAGNAAERFPPPVLMLQNNPIDLPIPREAELLPLDVPIPRGTKLAACWGRKWNYVTVLKDGKEDTVQIHWDDRPPEFDGLMHRSQLIIRRSDLKKLKIKATRSAMRVWTDATGKFSVEARLASRTSTQITIVKEDGKEITLSIDKLSNADKLWLKDNP